MMTEELRKLKELLDVGAITQEEFNMKKAEILSQPIAPPTQPVYSEHQTVGQAQSTGEKSKIAAGLLAIFLGTLGIHKFYLGYTSAGVIMLLVSIIGAFLIVGPFIMAVIALIEGIIYLTKTDEDFDRIYVRGKKAWF